MHFKRLQLDSNRVLTQRIGFNFIKKMLFWEIYYHVKNVMKNVSLGNIHCDLFL